jgi:hypothetical protein
MEKKVIIKKWERGVMYGFAGIVDIIQVVLNFFVVGAAANRIIDIVMGIILVAYGLIRKLLNVQKGLVLVAFFAGEMIPFVDSLPFWTLDIRNLYSGIPSKEEIPAESQENSDRGPVNKIPGVREPRKTQVLNSNRVRLPRKI